MNNHNNGPRYPQQYNHNDEYLQYGNYYNRYNHGFNNYNMMGPATQHNIHTYPGHNLSQATYHPALYRHATHNPNMPPNLHYNNQIPPHFYRNVQVNTCNHHEQNVTNSWDPGMKYRTDTKVTTSATFNQSNRSNYHGDTEPPFYQKNQNKKHRTSSQTIKTTAENVDVRTSSKHLTAPRCNYPVRHPTNAQQHIADNTIDANASTNEINSCTARNDTSASNWRNDNMKINEDANLKNLADNFIRECNQPRNVVGRSTSEQVKRGGIDDFESKRKEQRKSRDNSEIRLYKKSNHKKERRYTTLRSNWNSEKYSKMEEEEMKRVEEIVWTRMTPANLYYERNEDVPGTNLATKKCVDLCMQFKNDIVDRNDKISRTNSEYYKLRRKLRLTITEKDDCHDSDCSETSSSDDSLLEENEAMLELERKQKHPDRLHQELWHNDPGEMNDGPFCRCSQKARRSGIRHNIYANEEPVPLCEPFSNNANKLYHYRITISPATNFLVKMPTIIKYDDHEFLFEGFSLFSHYPIEKLPTCRVIRFNIVYNVYYVEEKMPENFVVRELDIFYEYFFNEILDLVDFELKPKNGKDGCPTFHFLPRFVREVPDNGKEILSMCTVLEHLMDSNKLLIRQGYLPDIADTSDNEWREFVDELKGMIVMKPGAKPSAIRLDQLDKDVSAHPENLYPDIVHFGMRPPQLSYAGNPKYQKLWKEYVKFRHLLANMPKPTAEDKRTLGIKEQALNNMRTEGKLKRGVTVVLSSEGFYKTGIMCDMVQHAMLIPVLVCHLRFHKSLDSLEEKIGYKFNDRSLLQMALTHPSYKESFGTNPDHVRNSLTNCGVRQPEYGDRKIHYANNRKRGINTLINVMSKFEERSELESKITHNERLEFLGDAVIEFITSVHLYHTFPDLEEGGLATFRSSVVQNQQLTILAKKLHLEDYMLFAHGSDLCHDIELSHAMANCFEALLGSLYLDGGIKVADKLFGKTLYDKEEDSDALYAWENYPPHPLQEQEPNGDRKWIPKFPVLQKLEEFEKSLGLKFRHIRLLARAFTDRSIGYTTLVLGSNQRMEFLGDTVIQLITSSYLYKHFPDHHEGHLSLLRSSLVNNKTQAIICDSLGMVNYAVFANPKPNLKVKDRADLLEAFLGALYLDQGIDCCEEFCKACFFPRLDQFIVQQEWNDPKSQLQQCCLTLRSMEGIEPDIPTYKVIQRKGPTNGRVYTVAVYFKGDRLAEAAGPNIQTAEMNAAKKAISNSKHLFPHLKFQKKAIKKSIKKRKIERMYALPTPAWVEKRSGVDKKLPKAYRQRANAEKVEEDVSSKKVDETKKRRHKKIKVMEENGNENENDNGQSANAEESSKRIDDTKKRRQKKTEEIEENENGNGQIVVTEEVEDVISREIDQTKEHRHKKTKVVEVSESRNQNGNRQSSNAEEDEKDVSPKMIDKTKKRRDKNDKKIKVVEVNERKNQNGNRQSSNTEEEEDVTRKQIDETKKYRHKKIKVVEENVSNGNDN